MLNPDFAVVSKIFLFQILGLYEGQDFLQRAKIWIIKSYDWKLSIGLSLVRSLSLEYLCPNKFDIYGNLVAEIYF